MLKLRVGSRLIINYPSFNGFCPFNPRSYFSFCWFFFLFNLSYTFTRLLCRLAIKSYIVSYIASSEGSGTIRRFLFNIRTATAYIALPLSNSGSIPKRIWTNKYPRCSIYRELIFNITCLPVST